MRISDWSSDVCSSDLLSVESNTSRSDARGSVMVAGISNCRTHEVSNPCRCRHCERAPESHARGRPPDGSTAGHRPDCSEQGKKEERCAGFDRDEQPHRCNEDNKKWQCSAAGKCGEIGRAHV